MPTKTGFASRGEDVMQNFVFRKALHGDIADCVHIYDRIIEEQDKGGFVVGWVHGIYPTAETAETALKNDELFVCEYNGKVVASGIINKTQVDIYAAIPWRETADARDDEVCVLHTLTVSPDITVRGCGSAFVNFYENYAAAHGCRNLRIDTNVKNTRARKLYAKLGFREAGVERCTFNGLRHIDLVCLEKRLPVCVRKYSPRDKEDMRFICRVTADKIFKQSDKTRTAVTTVYNDYFTEQEPEHIFVVADENDRAVGYIVCCADFDKFENCMKKIYIPKLVKFCPFLTPVGFYSIHAAKQTAPTPHLHMDILPQYQRRGWGTKLMNALREQLKSEGYPLLSVCGAAAGSPGYKMYTKYGFRPVKNSRSKRVTLMIDT